MTIKYLDSKRLSGISTGVPPTPTFEDDYTSGWTTNAGTGVTLSGGEVTWNIAGNQSNQISKAIGSTLSDTQWVLQFEIELSAYSSGEANIIALSSGTSVQGQTSTDNSIICGFGDVGRYNVWVRTGNGTDYSSLGSIDKPANGTRHYITLIRTSSSEVKLYVRTGSHTGSQVTNSPQTITTEISNVTGLDNVLHGGWNTGTASRTLTMVGDNVKIYDGVTSVPSNISDYNSTTNVQDNSIYIETDTAYRYWFNGTAWFPTFQDNFHSDGWTPVGGFTGVSGGVLTGDLIRNSTNHGAGRAITALDNSAWVMRFKLVINTKATSENNSVVMGISQTGVTGINDPRYGLGVGLSQYHDKFRLVYPANQTWYQAVVSTAGSDPVPDAGTYYIELKRTLSTSVTLNIFPNSS